MAISVFDLFKIGIGPSSSHTVGPMVAALQFVRGLNETDMLRRTARVSAELFGSLGATGKGHGSDKAVLLGLSGESPDEVDPDTIEDRLAQIQASRALALLGKHKIEFDVASDLVFHHNRSLPDHPNGMRFYALDDRGNELRSSGYYSIGGGFVVAENEAGQAQIRKDETTLPYAFTSAAELLSMCEAKSFSISDLMLENEQVWRTESEVRSRLLSIWQVMQDCVRRGCQREGVLPGGMKVRRRACELYTKLCSRPEEGLQDPLTVMDWVDLYALAVNEENAAGGRIVTAPTNGAAGIIPAVLHYYARFCRGADDEGVVRFLLTAGAIGILYKENAAISGAEVGCQGEVGSACSMAAGALTEVLGGTPQQVENAAEIGMEHNLGLTCDPVGGLVQVPCIERNAMAAIKAINAARMALRGDGTHFVSLDKVIKTMRDTGADMQTKYKETARGGLAVNVIEVPVNIIEC